MTHTLHKVIYELYDSDYLYIQDKIDADTHEIDREIDLVLDNGKHIYISWSDKPIQFSVGYKDSRWFNNESDKTLDASSWKMWKPLIGEGFELVFHGDNNQILELRARNTSIYFSPLEIKDQNWSIDVLHISSNKPKL